MFDTIVALMPKCEKVKKLQAICKRCNFTASFHIRTAPKSVTQMIGGEDMYKPMCRECYHTTANEISKLEAQMLSEDAAMNEDTTITLR